MREGNVRIVRGGLKPAKHTLLTMMEMEMYECSAMGNPEILTKISVKLKIDLLSVGDNRSLNTEC